MKSHHDVNVTVLCFVHCLFFVQCLGFEFLLFESGIFFLTVILEGFCLFVCLFIHVIPSFFNFFSSGSCLVFMVFWMPFQMGNKPTACFGSMIFI